MTKLSILLIFLTLFGCATSGNKKTDSDSKIIDREYPRVDYHLIQEVRRFGVLYKHYCKEEMDRTIDVRLENIEGYPNAAGVYHRIQDYTIISLKHWRRFTPMMREEVVFHELGHHVLNLGHDWSTDNIKEGCPKSIMYNKGAGNCYHMKSSYFIKELFKRAGCKG